MGYNVGDKVVYRKAKYSPHPGRRAKRVYPSPRGELYSYEVDKFWTVCGIEDDGTVLARTPGGKIHRLNQNDPRLRKANPLVKLLNKGRFPTVG